MRRAATWLLATGVLAACAPRVTTEVTTLRAPAERAPDLPVEILLHEPRRAHREIALIQARSGVGADRGAVLEALRRRGAALGADAVLVLSQERAELDSTLAYDPVDRPALGQPYPPLLEGLRRDNLGPGFGAYDTGLRGRSYRIEAVAIQYLDER